MSDTEDRTTSVPGHDNRMFFLLRLVTALGFFAVSLGMFAALKLLLRLVGLYESMPGRIISVAALVVIVYLGYALYLRLFEKRIPSEYSAAGWFRELASGMAIGGGLVGFQVAVLWLAGIYHVSTLSLSEGIPRVLLLSIVVGFSEELMSRGIVFRIMEEGVGSWLALFVSAVEVAATHATNTGATLLSTLSVAIEFGVMLSLFYMVTRRLWLVTGFHFAWNFSMGGVFGINVSGLQADGLLVSRLEGHPLLTGGTFGIEASIPAVSLCTVLSLLLLVRVLRTKHVVRPMWMAGSRGRP